MRMEELSKVHIGKRFTGEIAMVLGEIQRGSAWRGHRDHLGCRMEAPEKLVLSFYPIHSTNKHSSAQVLTRKHLFAHDKQACRPVIGNCIGEDYILEMLVLFGEDFCKKRALV